MSLKDYVSPEIDNIQDVYEYLEENIHTTYDVECISIRLGDYFDKISDDEKINLKIEINALSIMISDGKLEPLIVSSDKNGNKIHFPDIKDFDNNFIEVLKLRISNTKNLLLKSKYSFIVWYIKHDIEYAKLAITSALDLINICEQMDKNNTDEFCDLETVNAFELAANLSYQLKIMTDEVKNKSFYLLYNYYPKSNSIGLIKNKVIGFLIKSVTKKIYSKTILEDLALICKQQIKSSGESLSVLDFTEHGKKISKILKQNIDEWDLIEAQYYEKMMKNKRE